MYNAQSCMNDNIGLTYFYKQFILLLYTTYSQQKRLTSLIFNTIVSNGEGSIHLHDPTAQIL